jgi:hypothetical protein
MATYAVGGNQATVVTTNKGAVAVFAPAASLKRGKWYEFSVGATAVPNTTDCAIQFDISRMAYTSLIVGTSFTPSPTDFADGAAALTALTNETVELASNSITVSLYNLGINQRNTFRWIAAQESQFLISPAVALNGLYARVLSAFYGGSCAFQITYLE